MNQQSKNKLPTINSLSKIIKLSGKLVRPRRDWNILMLVFIFLIIISVSFDVYMYQKIVSGDMYVSVKKDELTIENLKSNDLKKILNNFEAKKEKITLLKLEKLVDPSL